jgi:hypothetical protein
MNINKTILARTLILRAAHPGIVVEPTGEASLLVKKGDQSVVVLNEIPTNEVLSIIKKAFHLNWSKYPVDTFVTVSRQNNCLLQCTLF